MSSDVSAWDPGLLEKEKTILYRQESLEGGGQMQVDSKKKSRKCVYVCFENKVNAEIR